MRWLRNLLQPKRVPIQQVVYAWVPNSPKTKAFSISEDGYGVANDLCKIMLSCLIIDRLL